MPDDKMKNQQAGQVLALALIFLSGLLILHFVIWHFCFPPHCSMVKGSTGAPPVS
jgi:hypothetical protein